MGGGLKGHKFFEKIISLENLFSAWSEFKKGKEQKNDVLKFALDLEDHLFELRQLLRKNIYQHSDYTSFYISDPKLRHIHKAEVIDRILHHAVAKITEPIFEKRFIFDSYSNRKNKGIHKAIKRIRNFAWQLSSNNTKIVWILKCDIRKFFDSVDHQILIKLIKKRIKDRRAIHLIKRIINSFEVRDNKGIPLGNLTSQLFSNIYLDPLDQFIKRNLRTKYYLRYTDDFLVLSRDKFYLKNLIPRIDDFLKTKLKLQLHPKKIIIRKWNQGIDFLGYLSFPHHTLLRTKTKKRMLRNMKKKKRLLEQNLIPQEKFKQSLNSYLGLLKNCRSYQLQKKLKTLDG